MTDDAPESFARRVARSFLYTALGNGAGKVINLVAQFAILLVVSKGDYGLAVLVASSITIMRSVTEMSLGVALVQAKDPTREQMDSLFWVSALIVAGVVSLLVVGAPGVAWFYDEPRMTALLQVQGAALIPYTIGFVPRAMMERDLQFGRLALIDNGSALVGSLSLVGLGIAGFGVWSFVWAEVATQTLQALGSQLARPHRPRLVLRMSKIGHMLRFGLYASGSRILYNVYTNADYLIVGKVFSDETLGLYAFAYRVISDPAKALAGIVNRVAYPTFARLQGDLEQLRRYLFGLARASLTLIGTLLVVFAIYLDALLPLLGYEQYLDAVPLARLFAVIGLLQAVAPLVPQLLNAVGNARANFLYSACCAVVMPAAFVIGAQFGMVGVAAAWAIAYPLVVLVLMSFGSLAVGVPLYRFVPAMLSGLLVVGPTAALGILIELGLQRADAGPGGLLAGAVSVLALGVGLGLWRERDNLARLRRPPKAPA